MKAVETNQGTTFEKKGLPSFIWEMRMTYIYFSSDNGSKPAPLSLSLASSDFDASQLDVNDEPSDNCNPESEADLDVNVNPVTIAIQSIQILNRRLTIQILNLAIFVSAIL